MTPLILREAWALVRSQVALTVMILLLVAGTTSAVMLTAGRSAATERAVLATVDAQGTRSITIRSKSNAGALTTDLVDTLTNLDDVEAVTGFAQVKDATPAALPDGGRIGVREAVGTINGRRLTQPAPGPLGPAVWVSEQALDATGLSTATGSLRYLEGRELIITQRVDTPAYLADLEPLAVVPAPLGEQARSLSAVYVLARTPAAVSAVTAVAQQSLKDIPPDQITITTTQAAADLRAAISGELTRRNRSLILSTFAASSAATALTVLGYVTTRRRDFGRRRALGATRLMIVLLVQAHLVLTALTGAALGLLVSLTWTSMAQQPAPSPTFAAAVALAATAIAALAALPPLAFAATRDPVRELRVP